MRKLMWLLPAVALWIAPPAAEAQFGRRLDPLFGPTRPGAPSAGDPFGLTPGTPGIPGAYDRFAPRPSPFDPFALPPSPFDRFAPPSSPFDHFNPPNRPGLPGQRFGPPWDVPGRPGGTARFFDPQPSAFDPANPLNRVGPPGRDIGPITPRPGPPDTGNQPSGKLVTPPVNPPHLDMEKLLDKGKPPIVMVPPGEPYRLGPQSLSQAPSDSQSFDPRWWPWLLGGGAAVFVLSLIAGYFSGRCDV
jgi:hypothetical protein